VEFTNVEVCVVQELAG